MNPEVRALLDKASDNAKAARLLLENNYADIAASRVYYAMFYAAEALLLTRQQVFSSHSAVVAAFGREFAKTKDLDPTLHRYLISAQDLRQSSDYDTGPAVAREQVELALQQAQEFIAAAETFLAQA